MHLQSFRILDNPKFLLQNNRRMNEHLFCLKFKSKHILTKKSFYYNFPGLTAIEAWMLACILFVFGALVEYAAILFRKQKVEKKEVSLKKFILDTKVRLKHRQILFSVTHYYLF